MDQQLGSTLQSHLDGDPEFAAALMGKYLRNSLGWTLKRTRLRLGLSRLS